MMLEQDAEWRGAAFRSNDAATRISMDRDRGNWSDMAKEVHSSDTAEREQSLVRLHDQCRELLAGLDEMGLHQAAAHVSMALDVMRRSFPQLDGDD